MPIHLTPFYAGVASMKSPLPATYPGHMADARVPLPESCENRLRWTGIRTWHLEPCAAKAPRRFFFQPFLQAAARFAFMAPSKPSTPRKTDTPDLFAGTAKAASAKAAASANGRSKEGANSVNGRNRPTRVGMPLPNKETPAPGCRRAPTRRCALCTTVLCAFSAGPVTPEKSDPEASDETHTETSPSGGIT